MSFILRMIEEGEHQQQDFKLRVDDAHKIAKTLSAFANTEGGRMLIGVRDSGDVVGCRVEEEIHMVKCASDMHCVPPVPFETQVWKHQYLSVLEIKVPKSAQRPHFVKHPNLDGPDAWQAYLRKDDRIHKASPVMVKVWQYEMRMDRSEFRYDEYVGRLFKRWREGQTLRFPQVARTARISFGEAEDLLALLTVWGIVECVHEKSGMRYGLASEEALDQLETQGAEAFRWKHAG
jgi:predicted HTH transcriptional regulator